MVPKSERRFIRLNLITIVVTLLLVLAGGIVRSTGSGMGCPDWPKCFDRYVPPTSVSDLPASYKDKYVLGRIKKNERFAASLEKLGYKELADSIRRDTSILQPETFNPAKTWTEYLNRLVGAITGLLLILLTWRSFALWRTSKRIVFLSLLNLLAVAFQAWLGSIVVSTNLTAWIVTVHMLLALVILGILIYTYHHARQLVQAPTIVIGRVVALRVILFTAIMLSIVQIILGTEVREAVDSIAKKMMYSNRSNWLENVGRNLSLHRDMAVLVLLINLIIYKMVKDKFSGKTQALMVVNGIGIILIIQILSGMTLAYFGLPPVAQALHILFSTVLFSLQYYLYLLVYRTVTYK